MTTTRSNKMDRSNGHGPSILPLEIDEDEEESLIYETSHDTMSNGESGKDGLFNGRDASSIRHRKKGWSIGGSSDAAHRVGVSAFERGNAMIRGMLRGEVMEYAVYHMRNALMLGVLALFVLIILKWEGGILKNETMEDVEPARPLPHSFDLGGKNNLAQSINGDYNTPSKKPYHEKTEEEEMAELEDEILEDMRDKTGAWDLAYENEKNEQGHYLHDPETSPYASHLYKASQQELDARQAEFMKRMNATINDYGIWQGPSVEGVVGLDYEFFDRFDFRDADPSDFPDFVWQKSSEYIESFLQEAQALVEATKEGIMREYNHINPGDREKAYFDVIIGEKEFKEGMAWDPPKKKNENSTRTEGIAYMPQKSWDGLIKKLLHAMITEDHFYVVVAGTEETYGANNFARTQAMQFNYIMEPVFHKLGMKLISRNMGTLISPVVSALGGADILGETDVLWHVAKHHDEEVHGEFDLLQKQVIMSGERMPVILSPKWDELIVASKGQAWVGNLQPGAAMCELTTLDDLPVASACHGVNCDAASWESGTCHVYDSVCWEERSDYIPKTQQNKDVGSQNKQFPGFRRHQLEARKMSMLILHALSEAMDLWQEKVGSDRYTLPLAPEYWHVKKEYMAIRESVMSTDRTPGEAAEIPACEMFLNDVDPRICHIPMRAYTEWTPRVVPRMQGLLTIINNLVAGEDEAAQDDAYEGPDILPLQWKLNRTEFDVHTIAIAANVSSTYDDDAFAGYEYFEDDDWIYNDGFFFRGRRELVRSDPTVRFELSEAKRMRKVQARGARAQDKNQLYRKQRLLQQMKETPAPEKATPLTPAPTSPPVSMTVVEGSGWMLENMPIGFCDGSAQSRCNRRETSPCLLANTNHYRGTLVGTHDNGWLTMTLRDVSYKIILARMWFEKPGEGSKWPGDFMFDYAINDKVKSLNKKDLDSFGKTLVNGLTVYPLLLDKTADPSQAEDEPYEYSVAIRVRCPSQRDIKVHFSHIYYA